MISEREDELLINKLNTSELRFEQKEFENLANRNDSLVNIKLWLEFKEDYPLRFELTVLVLPYSL